MKVEFPLVSMATGHRLLALGSFAIFMELPPFCSLKAQVDTSRAISSSNWELLTGRGEYQRHRAAGYARPRHRLLFESSGLYDSHQLRNELMRALWRGGEVSREAREGSQEELDAMNRAGYAVDAVMTYAWTPHDDPGMAGRTRVLRFAHHDLMGARFTEDAYNLTFFGNKAYAGSTADLTGSAHERIAYQTIGFGLGSRAGFVELAIVNGQGLDAADLDYAALYTSTDGTGIIANIDGEFVRSDTSFTSTFGRSKGIGAAITGMYTLYSRFLGWRWNIELAVEDLGFIVWNPNSLSLHLDEPVQYTGLEVDDIFDLDGLVLSEGEVRERYGLQEVAGSFTGLLPWKGEIRFTRRKNVPRWSPNPLRPNDLVLGYRSLPGALPFARYSYFRNITRRWIMGASAQAGGFGGLRVGLVACGIVPSGHFCWRAALPNIVGMIGEQGRGAAVEFALSYEW